MKEIIKLFKELSSMPGYHYTRIDMYADFSGDIRNLYGIAIAEFHSKKELKKALKKLIKKARKK